MSICWEELSLPNNSFIESGSSCFISGKHGAVYLLKDALGFIDVNKREVSNIILPSGYLAVSMLYGLTFYWEKMWVVLHKIEDKSLRLFSYNYDVNYEDRWCEYKLPDGVTISDHAVIYGNPSYEDEDSLLVCSFTQKGKDKIFRLGKKLNWHDSIDLPAPYNVVGTSGDKVQSANFLRFHKGVHLCLTNTQQQDNIASSLGASYSLFPQGNPKGSTSYWGKEPTDALLRTSGGSCSAIENNLFEILSEPNCIQESGTGIYRHHESRGFQELGMPQGSTLNLKFPLTAWDKKLIVCVNQVSPTLKSYDIKTNSWESIDAPNETSIAPSFQACSDGLTLICGFQEDEGSEVSLYMVRV